MGTFEGVHNDQSNLDEYESTFLLLPLFLSPLSIRHMIF